jgi:hypothetical protein
MACGAFQKRGDGLLQATEGIVQRCADHRKSVQMLNDLVHIDKEQGAARPDKTHAEGFVPGQDRLHLRHGFERLVIGVEQPPELHIAQLELPTQGLIGLRRPSPCIRASAL